MRNFNKAMAKIGADLAKIGESTKSSSVVGPSEGQSSGGKRKLVEVSDDDCLPLVRRSKKNVLAKRRPLGSPSAASQQTPPPNAPSTGPSPGSSIPEEAWTSGLRCRPADSILGDAQMGLTIGRSMITPADKSRFSGTGTTGLAEQAILCCVTATSISAELLERVQLFEGSLKKSEELRGLLEERVKELEASSNRDRAVAEKLAKELEEAKSSHAQEVQALKEETKRAAEQAVKDFQTSEEFEELQEADVMEGMKKAFQVALDAVERVDPHFPVWEIDVGAELLRASGLEVPATPGPIIQEAGDEAAPDNKPI